MALHQTQTIMAIINEQHPGEQERALTPIDAPAQPTPVAEEPVIEEAVAEEEA